MFAGHTEQLQALGATCASPSQSTATRAYAALIVNHAPAHSSSHRVLTSPDPHPTSYLPRESSAHIFQHYNSHHYAMSDAYPHQMAHHLSHRSHTYPQPNPPLPFPSRPHTHALPLAQSHCHSHCLTPSDSHPHEHCNPESLPGATHDCRPLPPKGSHGGCHHYPSLSRPHQGHVVPRPLQQSPQSHFSSERLVDHTGCVKDCEMQSMGRSPPSWSPSTASSQLPQSMQPHPQVCNEIPGTVLEPVTPLSEVQCDNTSNCSERHAQNNDTSGRSEESAASEDDVKEGSDQDSPQAAAESGPCEAATPAPASPPRGVCGHPQKLDTDDNLLSDPPPSYACVGDIPDDRLADTIAWVLNHFCENNETPSPIFPEPHEKAAMFFSPVRQKTFTLNFYCKRLVAFTYCSKSCFVVAILYIVRLSERHPVFELNEFNVHRLICTAVVLAAKFMDDMSFSNVHYARVAGVQTTNEMNELEASMLKALDYRLFVSVEKYEEVEKQIAFIAREYVS